MLLKSSLANSFGKISTVKVLLSPCRLEGEVGERDLIVKCIMEPGTVGKQVEHALKCDLHESTAYQILICCHSMRLSLPF